MALNENDKKYSFTEEQAKIVVNNKIKTLENKILVEHQNSKIFRKIDKSELAGAGKFTGLSLAMIGISAVMAVGSGFLAGIVLHAVPGIASGISSLAPGVISTNIASNIVIGAAMAPAVILGVKEAIDALGSAKDEMGSIFSTRLGRTNAKRRKKESVLELNQIKEMDLMEAADYILKTDKGISLDKEYVMRNDQKKLDAITSSVYKSQLKRQKIKDKINKKDEKIKSTPNKFKEKYEKYLEEQKESGKREDKDLEL